MRKKVLILGHNYVTQFVDIYNQYTRLFDPALYEVTVAYLTGKADPLIEQQTLAEKTLFLDMPKSAIRTHKIPAILRLYRLCKQENFQIVICHRYKPTYLILWVAQFCRIPACIFVMHELHTMSARGRQTLLALLFRKNMLLAGVSNAVRDDMRKDLWGIPSQRIVTLYNMIDAELMEPQFFRREQARQHLSLPPAAFVFGNVARLVPNKDQHTLINAFALIKPFCPNALLVLLGDGELKPALQQLVTEKGLTDAVIFTGFLPQGFRYMKAFDCFVLSSIQEAFGRVLIEAMLAKIPLIASRVNGIPEVIGTAGVLTDPRNVEQFAAAMRAIYNASPTHLAELGEKAYQHVLAQYSIPVFQQQFWQLPLTIHEK